VLDNPEGSARRIRFVSASEEREGRRERERVGEREREGRSEREREREREREGEREVTGVTNDYRSGYCNFSSQISTEKKSKI
jgi:hypothetical protein